MIIQLHSQALVCGQREESLAHTVYYHTSNSRKCMGVNGEALQLHVVYKKPYFLLQVTRESVSVLQVT